VIAVCQPLHQQRAQVQVLERSEFAVSEEISAQLVGSEHTSFTPLGSSAFSASPTRGFTTPGARDGVLQRCWPSCFALFVFPLVLARAVVAALPVVRTPVRARLGCAVQLPRQIADFDWTRTLRFLVFTAVSPFLVSVTLGFQVLAASEVFQEGI
jgi:hypothetical protein